MRYLTIALLALGAQGALAGYAYTSFGAGQWSAPDATLGITGYTIEDFEDLTLASGLQISVTSGNGGYGPSSTLPNTFNPFTDSTHGSAFQLGGGGAWDGTRGLINTRTNREFPYTESASWGFVGMHFSSPAASVGFSVQQMDLNAELWIDGVLQGAMATLAGWSVNGQRQGYLRIDATGSDTISQITIRNGLNGDFRDGIMFDHLAFSPVPEPASIVALGLGALIAVRRRRR